MDEREAEPHHQLRLLLADGREESRLLIRACLERNGYAVQTAADGPDALRLARETPPDALLANARLPGIDGFTLCRAVTGDPALQRSPVLLYTSEPVTPDDEQLALDLGACCFIAQPDDADRWGEVVAAALAARDRPPRAPASEQSRFPVAAEGRFEAMLEKVPGAVLLCDLEGRILFANPPALQLLGVPAAGDAVGRLLREWSAPPAQADVQQFLATARAAMEGGVRGELLLQTTDGARIVDIGASRLPGPAGDQLQLCLHDMTAERQIQEELARTRTLVEASPAILLEGEATGDWPITYVSQNIQRLGYSVEALMGRPALQLVYAADRARVEESVARALAEGRDHFRLEYRLVAPDGRMFWVDDAVTVRRTADGQPLSFQGVVIDISGRKAVEQALSQRLDLERLITGISARLMASIEQPGQAVAEALEALGHALAVDRAYLFLLDEDELEIQEAHEWCAEGIPSQVGILSRLTPERFPWLFERLADQRPIQLPEGAADLPAEAVTEKEALEQQAIKSLAAIPLRKGHRLIGMLAFDSIRQAKRLSDEDIDLLMVAADGFASFFSRTEMEQALAFSEERYRQLVERSPVALGVLDGEGRVRFANPALRRLFGGDAPTVLEGQRIDTLFQAAGRKIIRRAVARGVAGDTFRSDRDLHLRRQDGTEAWLNFSTVPVTLGGERLIQLLAQDLTERRHAESALRVAEQVVESSSAVAYCYRRDDGQVRYVSGNVRRLGVDPAELLDGSVDLSAIILPEDRARANRELERALRSGRRSFRREYQARDREGRIRWLQDRTTLQVDEGGTWLQGVITDVTDHRHAEERLRRLNRALRTVSQSNATLVHAQEEHALLTGVCRTLVQTGGYRLAWIAYLREGRLEPVASEGDDLGYLGRWQRLYAAGEEQVEEPVTLAVRSGEAFVEQQVSAVEQPSRWTELAAELGLEAYTTLPLRLNDQVLGALCIYSRDPHAFDLDEMRLLLELGDDIAFGVASLRAEQEKVALEMSRRRSAERLKESLVETIRAVALALEKRDPYTAGHQNRVAHLAEAIGHKLGLTGERIEGLLLGGMIHDIGKLAIPAEILSRPGELEPLEYSLIRGHPTAGYDIIKGIQFPWPLADMVLQHHERIDGSGYPRGLRGDEILLEARILAVADTVEAMASHRPYRPGLGLPEALDEIRHGRGVIYDAEVADSCLELFEKEGYRFMDEPRSFYSFPSVTEPAERPPVTPVSEVTP